jgi:DNA modification methylase
VHVDGDIAYTNIAAATRIVNGKLRLFPNHSRVTEYCEHTGFSTLPYILWKKPTLEPKYKGKGAFLGSGLPQHNAYVTIDGELLARATNMQTAGHKTLDQAPTNSEK